MKAVRLFAANDLRVVDIPIPKPANGELVVKVKAALICGTDLRMFKNGTNNLPLTLGHEFAGIIEATGKGVEKYEPGMRVAVAPNFGCGICDDCVSGNTQNCSSLRGLGIHLDGGFAEYVKIPAQAVAQGNVSVLADEIPFESAAIAEPFSCVYNSFERAHLKLGDSVLVIGAGPIGLLHAKVYHFAGAGLVMINDLNADRMAACVAQEPSIVAVPSDNMKERINELTKGRGPDIIITATAVPVAQQIAFSLAATNTHVIFFGGLPEGKENVLLNTNIIHYKQISVTGTSRQNLFQYRRCLDLITRGLINVRPIVTNLYRLDDAIEAFGSASRGEGLKSGFSMQ